MVTVMKGMNEVKKFINLILYFKKIMKKTNNQMDVKNIQQSIEIFNMEMEKQNIMQGKINIIIILFINKKNLKKFRTN